MGREELIEEIRRNIHERNMHENDADYAGEELRDMEEDDENYDYTSGVEDTEREYAHQLTHVINCDLIELSELLGETMNEELFSERYNVY